MNYRTYEKWFKQMTIITENELHVNIMTVHENEERFNRIVTSNETKKLM